MPLPWRALAADYDGTLADRGRIDDDTAEALRRWRASGRRLILVTGRRWEELRQICAHVDLFDRVVAENGALLGRPETGELRPLAGPVPPALRTAIEALDITPLAFGHAIIAFREPAEAAVRAVLDSLGLDYRISANKRERMALPAGIDKGSGLRAAIDELALRFEDLAGVGDAENDLPFLGRCGRSLAVANALPGVKQAVDEILADERGQGVAGWIRHALEVDEHR